MVGVGGNIITIQHQLGPDPEAPETMIVHETGVDKFGKVFDSGKQTL